MKRKEAAIYKAVENLETVMVVENLSDRLNSVIKNIQDALLDSLKSKKELRREALWGLHGGCARWRAENSLRWRKARKKAKK